MHELSIASSIVGIAERHARGRRVLGVTVKVGRLRQVVPDALCFSFELVTQGTLLDGAALKVETVPAVCSCRKCHGSTEQDGFPLHCRACGALEVAVTSGEELFVESLEMEEMDGAVRA